MQTGYGTFVETLRQILSAVSGIDSAKISFEKKGGRFAEAGDRILIEFAEHEDAREVCALYAEELYSYYRNGTSIENIVHEIVEDINKVKISGIYEQASILADYEKAKSSLFIRLLNTERNSEILKEAVYRTLGDIALVLYAKVSECDDCIASTKIHRSLINTWKKDEDEVFKEALLNTYFISPPRIYRWEQMIFDPDYEGENFMDLASEHVLKKDAMGNCLSTSKKTNGAVAVFLPGVAERLGRLLDSNFYIAFTSIHEVMIHDERRVHPEDLESILRETLREATPEEDFLSSHVYHYNRESHRFSCVSKKMV